MFAILLTAASLAACPEPYAVDGNTIRCGGERVRLTVIDAPELPGHCNPGRRCVDGDSYASKAALAKLLTLGPVKLQRCELDRYGRTLAHVYVCGQDLGAATVDGGAAVERYQIPAFDA